MYRILGFAIVAVGIMLLIWGISAADSFASNFSRIFTGQPTDRAMALTIGGIVAIVVGGALAGFSGRRGLKA